MSHFAKIENNIVTQVIVAEQDFIDTLEGTWVQTSYGTRGGIHMNEHREPTGKPQLRKNYAGIGYTYDAQRDAFIPPKPVNEFTYILDEDTCTWVKQG